MAYIQLAILGLQAVVYHGDTLTLNIYEHRPTMGLRFYNQWLNERRERLEQSSRINQAIQRAIELERELAASRGRRAIGVEAVEAKAITAKLVPDPPPYLLTQPGGKLVQLSVFFDPATGKPTL